MRKGLIKMQIQVLVPTMGATDFSKVEEMNLRSTGVIFANQTDHCGFERKEFPERGVSAVMISTNTRGVSLNRNIAMAYADAPIILFSDDDQRFADDFAQTVKTEFENHPEADGIKFVCRSTNPLRPLAYHGPAEFRKASFRVLMSAGVPAFAVRRGRLEKYDLQFPNSVGPGKEYNCGEDSVFMRNLLRSPLKIYCSPLCISEVSQEDSCWFKGYDEHYFITSGYIYGKIYGSFAPLMLVRKAWKLRKKAGMTLWNMISLQKKGMHRYRSTKNN